MCTADLNHAVRCSRTPEATQCKQGQGALFLHQEADEIADKNEVTSQNDRHYKKE